MALAFVPDGTGGAWVASLGAPRTAAARSVACARVDAGGACRGEASWSLPSAPLALAAAAPAGAPHTLALTADAHLWLLPLCALPPPVAGSKRAAEGDAGEGPPGTHPPPPAPPAAAPPAPAGAPSCAWQREEGGSADASRDGEAPARVAWPLALLPNACAAATAGDVALICRAGATPLALRLPARPPLPGELALPAAADAPPCADDDDDWTPACATLLARAACDDAACVARGWPAVSPALGAALQLPRAGLRRGRAPTSACSCARWALEGGACGAVRAHALSEPETDAEAPASTTDTSAALRVLRLRTAPRPLFHLRQRVVALLPSQSGDTLVIVGAQGRIVAACADDAASAALRCREWRAPCGHVDAAALLHDDALAVVCDGGAATMVSSPLHNSAAETLSWRRVLTAGAQLVRGIAAAPPDAARPLLLLCADGEVVAAEPQQAQDEAAHVAQSDEAAQVSAALRALAACDAAREALRPRCARADAEVAELSAALPAAAALAAAAAQARPAAAPLRCVLSDAVDDAAGDDEQFAIRLVRAKPVRVGRFSDTCECRRMW